MLSPLSSSFSSPMEKVGGRPRFGAAARQPAVVGGAVAAVKAFFFLLFFVPFSSTLSSGPISHLKFLIQQIPSPRSTKEERKFYTFILGLDLSLCLPFKLIRSSIPLVRFRIRWGWSVLVLLWRRLCEWAQRIHERRVRFARLTLIFASGLMLRNWFCCDWIYGYRSRFLLVPFVCASGSISPSGCFFLQVFIIADMAFGFVAE